MAASVGIDSSVDFGAPRAIAALDGLRVIDASSLIAGPICCQILGDFGAEVIKIEHPVTGDALRGHGHQKGGQGLWWKEISRNKRLIGLNLSTTDGAVAFMRLLATADVLVESFRPGTLERWGLDPDRLLAERPELVVLRLTGQHGPYADRPGFGTLAEAMSGFAHLTGSPDGPPTLPPFGLADSICGIAASSAVMMALWHRDVHGGAGQVIDISILEPMMAATGPGPIVYDQLGIVETRHGNRSTNNAPRNTYRTSDGHWVAVSTSTLSVARRVLALVGHPEVVDEPWFQSGAGRAEHADLLDGFVALWISERTRAEVLELFAEANGAIAPVYSAEDLVADEHVRAARMLVEVNDPELGPVLMHNVMWRMSATPGRIASTGGEAGADTHSILVEELGYSEDELLRLRETGAVG